MNDTLRLQASVELTAAADGRPAKISVMAYGGGVMDAQGFGPVVIELSGLSMPPTIPLLGDHISTLDGVAGSGQPTIRAGKLLVEGTLASTPTADRILSLSRSGVPLQASVGVRPGDRMRIQPGESVSANGTILKAGARGLTLIKSGTLQEVSILPLGADPSTSVYIAARRKGTTMDATETEVDPVAEERSRIQAIRRLCDGQYPDLESRAIELGWSEDQTRTATVEVIRASRRRGGGTLVSGRPDGRGEGSTKDMLAAACMLMGGHGELIVKAFGPAGERLANSTQRPRGWCELATMALQAEHKDVPSDRSELLRAGFSTLSMPVAIGEGIQKTALQVFIEQSATWRSICRIVNATSFREGKAVRLAASSRLQRLGRGGEIEHGVVGEDAFSYRISTYARMFAVTREDLVDDDAGLLQDLPVLLGAEAARTVSDLFADALIANTGNFFSLGHGNLTDNSLGLSELAEAVQILRTRKDVDNRIIGFVPSVLLVPAALESTARALLFSQQISRDVTVDNLPQGNPLQNLNLTLEVEPRLDADDPATWYLMSTPLHGAVLAAFLDGKLGVVVEQVDVPPNQS